MASSPSVCAVTGMTEEEKRDAETVWKKLIGSTPGDLKVAGINMLYWMFDTIPDMRSHFTKFSAAQPRSDLMADSMFIAHTQAVMLALDSIIKTLHDSKKLKERMVSLAHSHLKLSTPVTVGPDYFFTLAREYHKYLEAELNIPPGHRESKAWSKVASALATVVKEVQEHQASKSKK